MQNILKSSHSKLFVFLITVLPLNSCSSAVKEPTCEQDPDWCFKDYLHGDNSTTWKLTKVMNDDSDTDETADNIEQHIVFAATGSYSYVSTGIPAAGMVRPNHGDASNSGNFASSPDPVLTPSSGTITFTPASGDPNTVNYTMSADGNTLTMSFNLTKADINYTLTYTKM